MNFYVGIINEAVDYIEDSICKELSLAKVSQHFGISDFHFNRMFKTVAGITLKHYILGRRLTRAMEQLKKTDRSVIDIALDLGFEYPEVFSRAFKKQFGLSPAHFRDSTPASEGIPKVKIIERDIVNYKGSLALKGSSVLLEEFSLYGVFTDINENSEGFQETLKSKTESFLLNSSGSDILEHYKFYTVVNCHGKDNGDYTVFCGKKPVQGTSVEGYRQRIIPGGWYISFQYYGDMFEISEAFVDDLYRWTMVKEAELNPNGIGMINVYSRDYPENNCIQFLIPVKKPV